MDLEDLWPLFGLRITTPRLELRPPTDADFAELIDLVLAGIHDPAVMPFGIEWTDLTSPDLERSAIQYWWRCRADFSRHSWDLPFAVICDGRVVGMQNVMAAQFRSLRTAETGSWLGKAHQGKGIGTEMRRAVLHWIFEDLDALEVTSSAFFDNPASQRVSRAIGYEDNGTDVSRRRGERAEKVRFLLTRDRWLDSRTDMPIEVHGFEACRPMFGLDAR